MNPLIVKLPALGRVRSTRLKKPTAPSTNRVNAWRQRQNLCPERLEKLRKKKSEQNMIYKAKLKQKREDEAQFNEKMKKAQCIWKQNSRKRKREEMEEDERQENEKKRAVERKKKEGGTKRKVGSQSGQQKTLGLKSGQKETIGLKSGQNKPLGLKSGQKKTLGSKLSKVSAASPRTRKRAERANLPKSPDGWSKTINHLISHATPSKIESLSDLVADSDIEMTTKQREGCSKSDSVADSGSAIADLPIIKELAKVGRPKKVNDQIKKKLFSSPEASRVFPTNKKNVDRYQRRLKKKRLHPKGKAQSHRENWQPKIIEHLDFHSREMPNKKDTILVDGKHIHQPHVFIALLLFKVMSADNNSKEATVKYLREEVKAEANKQTFTWPPASRQEVSSLSFCFIMSKLTRLNVPTSALEPFILISPI